MIDGSYSIVDDKELGMFFKKHGVCLCRLQMHFWHSESAASTASAPCVRPLGPTWRKSPRPLVWTRGLAASSLRPAWVSGWDQTPTQSERGGYGESVWVVSQAWPSALTLPRPAAQDSVGAVSRRTCWTWSTSVRPSTCQKLPPTGSRSDTTKATNIFLFNRSINCKNCTHAACVPSVRVVQSGDWYERIPKAPVRLQDYWLPLQHSHRQKDCSARLLIQEGHGWHKVGLTPYLIYCTLRSICLLFGFLPL